MDHQKFDEALELAALDALDHLRRLVLREEKQPTTVQNVAATDAAKFILQLHNASHGHEYVDESDEESITNEETEGTL
jgi:hypothetical protein